MADKDKMRKYLTADKLKRQAETDTLSAKTTSAQKKSMKDSQRTTEKLIDKAQREAETDAGIPDKGQPMFYEKLRKESSMQDYKHGGMTKYYESGGDIKPTPKPKPKPKDVPEDDAPPTGPDGKYLKPRPFKKGGSVSSASKRADGCAVRGKTRA